MDGPCSGGHGGGGTFGLGQGLSRAHMGENVTSVWSRLQESSLSLSNLGGESLKSW